jgi:hypothetical protein
VDLYLKRSYIYLHDLKRIGDEFYLKGTNPEVDDFLKKKIKTIHEKPVYLLLDYRGVLSYKLNGGDSYRVVPLEQVGEFVLYSLKDKTDGFSLNKNIKIPIPIKVISGGWKAGNICEIRVHNSENLIHLERGFGIIVFDRMTGQIKGTRTFDTYLDKEEARKMKEFLDTIEKGDIFTLCIKDEGTYNLTEEVEKTLFSLGGTTQLMGKYQYSYALIGVKGAEEGSALEGASPDKKVILRNYGRLKIDYE